MTLAKASPAPQEVFSGEMLSFPIGTARIEILPLEIAIVIYFTYLKDASYDCMTGGTKQPQTLNNNPHCRASVATQVQK